jgi:5-methylcytosine-specific restriction endonuclease McrA
VRRGLEVHHVVALVDGGTNELSNLRVLCTDCHQAVTLAGRLR